MNPNFLKNILPHIIVVVLSLIIALAYMSPVLSGKNLKQHDVVQAKSIAKYNVEYRKSTGELPLWSPSAFSGMPAYMIVMDYPNSITLHLGRLVMKTLPEPANYVFFYLICCYTALCLLGMRPMVAFLGAIAYAFGAYNIINIGAGHMSKVIAVATAPPFLAAVIMTFRGKYLLGGVLVALFAGIHQFSNFVQITYYLLFSFLIFGIIFFIEALKTKQLKQFFVAAAIVVGAGLLSLGTHASRYWTTYGYSRETIRGKSDLSDEAQYVLNPETKKSKEIVARDGLDKTYAFSWSYGILETFNLFIPNFMGGASGGALPKNSTTFKTLTSKGVTDEQAQGFVDGGVPAYWGEQPGTGGPAYMGAILVFLAVFGFMISKNKLKWWALGSFGIFLGIAWGHNFFLNDFLFDYLPLFNKFRAVTMTLSVASIFLVVLAVLGLEELANMNKITTPNPSFQGGELTPLLAKEGLGVVSEQTIKKLLYAFVGTGGLALVFAVLGGMFFDFTSKNDAGFQQQLQKMVGDMSFASEIMRAIREDRLSLLRTDAFRTVFFISVAAGLVWAYLKKYVNFTVLVVSLSFFMLIDLWIVDKRYVNNASFVPKEEVLEVALTSADEQILKDKTNFRVLNMATSPFQDAETSFYHLSIGGYHAAKLKRYQELIEGHINNNNMGVLNMLNTKYIIQENDKKELVAITNPQALGNAWFVPAYKIVANADEEFRALKGFDALKIAFIDKKFEKDLTSLAPNAIQFDSTATIKLKDPKPDLMTYETSAKTSQLAIFSEIYYKESASEWICFIDGKEVPYMRANYVLRACIVPAGNHKIEFKFVSKGYKTGETIALISSIIMVLMTLIALFLYFKKNKNTHK